MADLDARAFVKRNGALWPSDFAADEYLAAIPEGREVLLRASAPRSIKHHRWFFALLRKVVRANTYWADEEDLLEDLKDATGHVHPDPVNPLTGAQRRLTKSICFASMGEDKFRRFRDRCLYVLKQKLDYDPLRLMQEVDAAEQRGSAHPRRLDGNPRQHRAAPTNIERRAL